MKAFLLACVAAVIVAIIGVVVLNSIQESADQAFTTSAGVLVSEVIVPVPLKLRTLRDCRLMSALAVKSGQTVPAHNPTLSALVQ